MVVDNNNRDEVMMFTSLLYLFVCLVIYLFTYLFISRLNKMPDIQTKVSQEQNTRQN